MNIKFALFASVGLATAAISFPRAVAAHSSPHAQPLGQSELVLPSGCDLFEASGTLELSLPADFFGAGSNPVQTTINLEGALIGTAGAFELGTASLILERLAPTTLDPLPSTSMRCELEVQDARFDADRPLDVSFGSVDESWSVSLHVLGGSQSDGYYDISRLQVASGSLSGELSVPLLVSFRGPKGQVLRHSLGTTTLSFVGATWVELPASASASIDVSQLPHGVAISTTLDSASVSLSLTPAVADPNRPGPHYVDPSASISPQVDSLGRGCTIEENVTIGADAVIGPSATIADGADVGVGAVVGAKASIGSNTQISSDSFVSSSTVLGDGVTIGAGAVVGEGTVIHSGAVVEADARIGANTVIGKGTTISTNARVGSDVYVGSQVLVGSDVVVPDGYKIAHGTNQANSIARCIRDDGTIEFRSLPASSWSPSSPPVAIQSDDGVISGPSQPTPLGLTTSSSTVSAPHDVVNPSTPPGGIGNLHNDIGNTIAPPSGGGTGHPYNHPYLCGWFAEQLRRRLAGLHYNTTFTCVWTKNPKARWYNRQRPWIDGHALVDIHWPDGTTSWIEAQLANGRGIDTRTPDLDGNGDGRVTAWDGKHKSKATDGNKRIEIYGSRAEAEAAGCSIPGN